MREARLILGDGGFFRSKSDHVHGLLFVQVDKLQFPRADWSDFIVVVVGWWCRACDRLLGGEEGLLEVPFMDGPYHVQMGPNSGQLIRLELIEDRSIGNAVWCQTDVSIGVLLDSVVSVAERVVLECRTRGWWSRDADELEDALISLKRARLRARLRIVR